MSDPAAIHIFDRSLLKRRRERAMAQIHDHDFLLQWAAAQVADRLSDIRRDFPLALEIGGRLSGEARENIKRAGRIETLVTMDLSPACLRDTGGSQICADEEFLPFRDHSLDLIISTLSLHAVNDLPGALVQIRRALKPDGLFLACMLGGETLHELRAALLHAEMETKGGASPRVFPFADKPQAGGLLQRAGFALPVVDSDIITVTYPHLFKLMHDLRFMGEGNIINARQKTSAGMEFFARAADYYSAHFGENDGTIRASFEVIFMIGWAPHESQQKPLRPGSAQNRLADALETQEIGAGETTGYKS